MSMRKVRMTQASFDGLPVVESEDERDQHALCRFKADDGQWVLLFTKGKRRANAAPEIVSEKEMSRIHKAEVKRAGSSVGFKRGADGNMIRSLEPDAEHPKHVRIGKRRWKAAASPVLPPSPKQLAKLEKRKRQGWRDKALQEFDRQGWDGETARALVDVFIKKHADHLERCPSESARAIITQLIEGGGR